MNFLVLMSIILSVLSLLHLYSFMNMLWQMMICHPQAGDHSPHTWYKIIHQAGGFLVVFGFCLGFWQLGIAPPIPTQANTFLLHGRYGVDKFVNPYWFIFAWVLVLFGVLCVIFVEHWGKQDK